MSVDIQEKRDITKMKRKVRTDTMENRMEVLRTTFLSSNLASGCIFQEMKSMS